MVSPLGCLVQFTHSGTLSRLQASSAGQIGSGRHGFLLIVKNKAA